MRVVVVAGCFLTRFEAVGLNQIEERPPRDYASTSHRNLSRRIRYVASGHGQENQESPLFATHNHSSQFTIT